VTIDTDVKCNEYRFIFFLLPFCNICRANTYCFEHNIALHLILWVRCHLIFNCGILFLKHCSPSFCTNKSNLASTFVNFYFSSLFSFGKKLLNFEKSCTLFICQNILKFLLNFFLIFSYLFLLFLSIKNFSFLFPVYLSNFFFWAKGAIRTVFVKILYIFTHMFHSFVENRFCSLWNTFLETM
jgi:hypothetical protein